MCEPHYDYSDMPEEKTLEQKYDELKARYDDLSKRYYELIMEVGNKYPGETRHETALRYIKEREDLSDVTADADGDIQDSIGTIEHGLRRDFDVKYGNK